jgi:hypothetical protein
MLRSTMFGVTALFLVACGPGSPSGSGGAGGVGGSGGSTSATTGGASSSTTTSATSSSSSGAGGTPTTLATDCVGSALVLAAPLDASDGLTNANGILYHEEGAWAARCFLPPSYPFAVDKFLYSVGLTAQGGPCAGGTDVDHEVVIFTVPSLPVAYATPMVTIPVPATMLTFDINSKVDVAIDIPPGIVVSSGYVCAGVVEHILDPTSRTCAVACDQQTAENPDFDYWTADGADGMVNCDANGCFLIPFDVSPDATLGQMFGLDKWRFLYSIEGRLL